MPATTPNYAIPYPLITDFVKDGASNMEAIAEKVDDILSTGAAARNLLYNGAMQIHQRVTAGTGVTGITGNGYNTADRWLTDMSALGTWTQSVENDAPTGSGFRKSLKMLCTTANASPAAGAYAYMTQRLEGQDCQAIKKGTSSAQSLTVSFWVKSNLTGTYVVRLLDQDNSNRMTSAKYTINASATWEYKTITFGPDTTGQFDNDNAASLWVSFWLAGGSNFTSGTTQSWGAYTAANEAPQQANLAATVNNYWQITGVQLTIGTVAPPFQFKSFGQELSECQRYYEKSYSVTVAPGTSSTPGAVMCMPGNAGFSTTGIMDGWVTFATSKRAGASVVVYDPVGNKDKCRRTKVGVSNNDNQSTTDISSDPNGFYIRSSSGADANTMVVHYTAGAEL